MTQENKPQGGFFHLFPKEACTHPEHKSPSHLHIPNGMGYRHVCPACGATKVLIPSQVVL